MILKGKRALVTGGAVRIGAAICRALARAGVDVCIHYRSGGEAAAKLAAQLCELGTAADTVQADLADASAIEAMLEYCRSGEKPLDIVINNAALFNKQRTHELTPENISREMRVNLMAPMLITAGFVKRAARGKIINLLDKRIEQVDPNAIAYGVSKKGLAAFTRAAALDLAPHFTVNGVAPGAILPPPGEGEEYLKEKAGPVPLERQCTPDDIAEAILYLLRTDAVTGEIICVDGGQHLL